MRKINNNYLGDFYIEELENRETKDRVKLFDSDENYLDYLPLERYDINEPTFEEQYDSYIDILEHFETVRELMDWLVCDCDFIGSESDAIKYVLTEWNLPDDECDPLDSEWVNRIGDVYIIISEY